MQSTRRASSFHERTVCVGGIPQLRGCLRPASALCREQRPLYFVEQLARCSHGPTLSWPGALMARRSHAKEPKCEVESVRKQEPQMKLKSRQLTSICSIFAGSSFCDNAWTTFLSPANAAAPPRVP